LGVFSLMDAILGRPISEIVSEIALPNEVRAALLGKANRYWKILQLVKAFEAGRWSEVSELVVALRQDDSRVASAYLEAVAWAQNVFKV